MRRLEAARVVGCFALGLVLGCSDARTPPALVPRGRLPRPSAAVSTDAGCRDALPAEREGPAPPRAPRSGARVDLGALFPARAPISAAAPVLELGVIDLRRRLDEVTLVSRHGRGAAVDIARRSLPKTAVSLPIEAQRLWEARCDQQEERWAALRRRALATMELGRCAESGDCDVACLRFVAADEEKHAARVQRAIAESDEVLVRELEPLAARQPPFAPALLVLGWVLELQAREHDEVMERPATALAAAIEHYRRAAGGAGADTETGWFARYFLALASLDAGEPAIARVELADLAAAPPRSDGGSAEAAYRLGELEEDPGRASVAFGRAVELARTGPAAVVGLIRIMARYRAADAALSAGQLRRALDTAAPLLEMQGDIDVGEEARSIVAAAIGELPAGERGGLPSVPPDAFADIGMRVADTWLAHRDVAGAAHVWKAVSERAPESIEAPRALAARIAERERAGDRAGVDALRLERPDYGPTSPWAEALRAGRAPEGHPKDSEIDAAARAAPPRLPALATTDDELRREARERVLEVVRACSDDGVVVMEELEVRLDRAGALSARRLGGGSKSCAACDCIRRYGPTHLAGFPRVAHARLTGGGHGG